MPKRPPSPRAAPAGADSGEPAAPALARAGAVGGATVPPLDAGTVAVHEGLTLIEVADPADLAALLADPRLAELILARIGERAAVALPQVAPRLLMALAKAGLTPTVEGGP